MMMNSPLMSGEVQTFPWKQNLPSPVSSRAPSAGGSATGHQGAEDNRRVE